MKTGRFITLEGGEGAGKSTNLAFARECLEQAGHSVLVTREPGGTALGEALRNVLLSPSQGSVDPMAELLMMFAARAQHVQQVIRPALAAGCWVLCDRFTDASYAYQGGGRGIPLAVIRHLEEAVQGDLRPDLVILLDLPVAEGMRRAGKRGDNPDRIERETLDFFERVRSMYLGRAAQDPARYCVVDAAQALPQVQASLRQCLHRLLQPGA